MAATVPVVVAPAPGSHHGRLMLVKQHKLWIDGNVTPHRTSATAHVGGDSAVTQADQVRGSDLNVPTVSLGSLGLHETVSAQKRIASGDRDISSVACPGTFTDAFSSDDGPVAEPDLACLEGDVPTTALPGSTSE